MLASSKVIGFVPAQDSAKARSFYEGKLGFRFVSDDMFALVMKAGETMIRIAKAQDFTPAPYTVLGWEVQDIALVVGALSKQGVKFERYPGLQQDAAGIWRARRDSNSKKFPCPRCADPGRRGLKKRPAE